MKFRFLGEADCPDWLLAEINTLSRMTSIKMKVLGQLVAKSLTDGELDEDKIKKITQDAKLEFGDAKAIVAALELILSSSARHAVSAADLGNELQQLGLPREHSAALARLHADYCPQISNALAAQSLRTNSLSAVEVIPSDNASPFVKIEFRVKNIDGKADTSTINIMKDDVSVLLAELKRVKSLMEGL